MNPKRGRSPTVGGTVHDHAVVAQPERLPNPAGGGGATPTPRLHFSTAPLAEVNLLLARAHYLGPLRGGGRLVLGGYVDGDLVAAQVWRGPTSRHLPGHWLELSRWCLTPAAGPNAGSRMQGWAAAHLRRTYPDLTTLISYSDPSVGHTGALYRASNWRWAPTWHRLRPPPTANGDWGGKARQAVKDRWVYDLRPDEDRACLAVNDNGALRRYLASEEWAETTHRWPSNLLAEATERGLIHHHEEADHAHARA